MGSNYVLEDVYTNLIFTTKFYQFSCFQSWRVSHEIDEPRIPRILNHPFGLVVFPFHGITGPANDFG